jgi:hypothetical protein
MQVLRGTADASLANRAAASNNFEEEGLMPTEAPVGTAPVLRVFISYKGGGSNSSGPTRESASDKIHVFVSGMEKEGTDFCKSVLEGSRTALHRRDLFWV